MRKLVVSIFIISLLVLSGCNISDYKYESTGQGEQICDDKTKICYSADQVKDESEDEFDEEFEKLKKIVEDMNKEDIPPIPQEETEVKVEEKLEEVIEKPTEEEKPEAVIEATVEEKPIKVIEEEKATEIEIDFDRDKTVIDKYVRAYAGELVKLNVKGNDPDGDDLIYTFSAPLDEKGEWQTVQEDIGKYSVYVTVTDGTYKETKRIQLEVTKFNRPPVLQKIPDIEVYEGATVYINARATDEDNDPLSYRFSGWMDSNVKKTGYEDAGEYAVKILVTDDDGEIDSQIVNILVKDKNRPPVIEEITLE